MSEREYVPLGDVARVRSGFAFKSSEWCEAGTPVVKIKSVKRGEVSLDGCSYVNDASAARASAYVVREGDTLIGMSGADLGEVGIVKFKTPALLNQRVGKFEVTDGARLDYRYLQLVLKSPEAVSYFKNAGYGSAQPNISPALIQSLHIPLPDLSEQRAIASTLGAIDDLIDTNRQIAEDEMNLARMCVLRALNSSDEEAALVDVADFINGKNFTKDASGRGLPVIRTPEVRTGPTKSTIYDDAMASPDHTARSGDTLFVWSGSLLVDRWRWSKGLVNQHIFKVKAKNGYPEWLAYFLIERQMDWFLSLAADKATTMGHIKREHLHKLSPIPSRRDIERLDRTIQPLWRDSLEKLIEIDELSDARDALLPLLTSGKLVPNVTGKLLEGV